MNNCDINAAERRLKERNAVARQYLNRFNQLNNIENQPKIPEEKAVPKEAKVNAKPQAEKPCENSSSEQAKTSQNTYQNTSNSNNNSNCNSNKNANGILGELFGGNSFSNLLNLDNDKLLIIALGIILVREKEDI